VLVVPSIVTLMPLVPTDTDAAWSAPLASVTVHCAGVVGVAGGGVVPLELVVVVPVVPELVVVPVVPVVVVPVEPVVVVPPEVAGSAGGGVVTGGVAVVVVPPEVAGSAGGGVVTGGVAGTKSSMFAYVASVDAASVETAAGAAAGAGVAGGVARALPNPGGSAPTLLKTSGGTTGAFGVGFVVDVPPVIP
jgi:hypothetical protein